MTALGNKEVMSKNLKYYIEKSGKDRKTLSEIWGFPYSTVSEWLNAKKYPRIDRIEIMANYFGIQKSDLIEDKEKPTAADDGLSRDVLELIDYVKALPEDKVQMLLQVAKSIK